MILEFNNYRTFLKQTLSERIQKNPAYSMRSMARQLEMAPSMLSSVLNGSRNLSFKTAYRVASRLGLSETESEYLLLLVQLEASKSLSLRSTLSSKLQTFASQHTFHDLAADRFRMIADWYHLPILEMCELTHATPSPALASQLLGISRIDADLAFERLERLGLIRKDSKGRFQKVHDNLLATSDFPDDGLRSYHRKMLEKAIESIQTQSPEQKLIGSFNVALDPSQLEEAKTLLKEFFSKIGTLASRGKTRSKLYHLTSVFFDLTHQRKLS